MEPRQGHCAHALAPRRNPEAPRSGTRLGDAWAHLVHARGAIITLAIATAAGAAHGGGGRVGGKLALASMSIMVFFFFCLLRPSFRSSAAWSSAATAPPGSAAASSAAALAPTNSLSQAWGVSGMCCGWGPCRASPTTLSTSVAETSAQWCQQYCCTSRSGVAPEPASTFS